MNRLTPAQKKLLYELRTPEYAGFWTELNKCEFRTALALSEKGLIEFRRIGEHGEAKAILTENG